MLLWWCSLANNSTRCSLELAPTHERPECVSYTWDDYADSKATSTKAELRIAAPAGGTRGISTHACLA